MKDDINENHQDNDGFEFNEGGDFFQQEVEILLEEFEAFRQNVNQFVQHVMPMLQGALDQNKLEEKDPKPKNGDSKDKKPPQNPGPDQPPESGAQKAN